jgi:hypothetical protein
MLADLVTPGAVELDGARRHPEEVGLGAHHADRPVT